MVRPYFFISVLFCCIRTASSSAQDVAFISRDVQQLLGEWKGTLAYLDYTSKKPFTMPANVKISGLANNHQLVFSNVYPNEPKANNVDTIMLTNHGKMLGREVAKSRRLLSNGNIEIVTEYSGVDGNDNKPALIRCTYTFGKSIFMKRKDVQFVGYHEWITRHQYSYGR
ncbi:MAG: hypothetical protein M3040_11050 [Bacteroidota bacterium]|nr:hypothetical protein [Bacteroidota bacterium]